MEAQLSSLYADREKLLQELGVADASEIVSMVRSTEGGLEAQLRALYSDRETLAQELGVTEAADIIARFRNLTNSMEWQLIALYEERERLNRELGISDSAEIVTMVRNLEAQLRDLYQLQESYRASSNSGNGTEQAMEEQLISLYGEREKLTQEFGTADATDIILMLRNLETQLRDLYQQKESGQFNGASPAPASFTSSTEAAMEAQLISLYAEREKLHRELGIADADDLIAMIRNLEAQLRDLYQNKEIEPGFVSSTPQSYISGFPSDAAGLLAQISGMEAQLKDLYAERERLYRELGTADAESIITMLRNLETQLRDLYQQKESGQFNGASPAPASSTSSAEAAMEAQLISLYAEREKLHRELGIADADDLIAMIRNLEAQLRDLYRQQESAAPSASSGTEAAMEAQLISLYAEREKLTQEFGTAEANDIIAMLRNLEAQLRDLYQQKEMETGRVAASAPAANGTETSMEAQLISLYAEREHAARELGISDIAELITMVRNLEAQLKDLYQQTNENSRTPAEASRAEAAMEAQLISLYAEREKLHRELGIADADDLLAMIRNLETQLRDLYQQKETGSASNGIGTTGGDSTDIVTSLRNQITSMEAQLISLYGERERAAQELGVADVTELIAMVRNLEAQLRDLYQQVESQPLAVVNAPVASYQSDSQAGKIVQAVRQLDRQLSELLDEVESQLTAMYAEREQLRNELNISAPSEIIALVRSLEAQLRDLYQSENTSVPVEPNPVASAAAPASSRHKAQTMSAQMQGLYSQIELQLTALRAEQSNLARELGSNGAEEVVRTVARLDAQLQSLKQIETQIVSLYAERDELIDALGISETADIVAMVRSLEAQLRDLYQKKETSVGTTTSFVSSEMLSVLPTMSRARMDACDFGIIQVDDSGTILAYNRYEAELAGVEPSHVEGKNFFTQVAPCTNNRLLAGRFFDGVAAGSLNEVVPYTFSYRMKPTNVTIHLFRDPSTRTNWILVKKR
jgi:photoactive yellow protein